MMMFTNYAMGLWEKEEKGLNLNKTPIHVIKCSLKSKNFHRELKVHILALPQSVVIT